MQSTTLLNGLQRENSAKDALVHQAKREIEKLNKELPYYRKLTLYEIKVLEINANLMGNDFRIKKINAKEEVEFHKKGNKRD